jgi:NADPH-dependent 2,4-dienoyl-CoA reductase/sulfur reductase-like enzyme
LSVVLLDRASEAGGQIWRHRKGAALPRLARRWLARLEASGARFVSGSSVVDAQASATGFDVLARSSERGLHVDAAALVLATGARELFIPFDGWTLPGVIGIGGAQALLKSGASFVGKRVVIAGSGPLMLPVAAALARAGAKVLLVAEQASRASVARFSAGLVRKPAMLLQAARYRARFASTPYSMGTWVTAAQGVRHVESVTVSNGRRTWRESVDVLCTGYGLVPNIELARLFGCESSDGAVLVDALQQTSVANVFAVGETTGIGGVDLSLVEGQIAGEAVGAPRQSPQPLLRRRAALQDSARAMAIAFAPRPELRTLTSAGTIVCRCEDVKYESVQRAACTRQAKLYTRLGMGSCQGRTCMPGIEFLLGWQPDTVRPPIEPAPVSVLSSEFAQSAASAISFNSPVGDATQ